MASARWRSALCRDWRVMMADYDVSTYGDRIADVYDGMPTIPDNADAAVEVLASLAGREPVLELGIGTGRLALPLAARGLAVHGIDASPGMIRKLRAKPGGDRIPVTLGNFADLALGQRFSLIFVAFNTFFGLLTQDHQVRCFVGVASHLTPGGVFVIEAFVPDLGRFDRGQRLAVTAVGVDGLQLEASLHDPVTQRVRSHLVVISTEGTQLYPVQLRYAWPAELDLMARLAGLQLRDRWGGWDRRPFTGTSSSHVSVYAPA